MSEDENKERLTINMAMMLAYECGFRSGIAFHEERGEDSRQLLDSGFYPAGDSGDVTVAEGVFGDHDYRRYAKLLNWILGTLQDRLDEFGDHNLAFVATRVDLADEQYILRQLGIFMEGEEGKGEV